MTAPRVLAVFCMLLVAGSAWASPPHERTQAVTASPGNGPRPALIIALPAKATARVAEWVGDAATTIGDNLVLSTFNLTTVPVSTVAIELIEIFGSRHAIPGIMNRRWATQRIDLIASDYGMLGIINPQWLSRRIEFAAGVGLDRNDTVRVFGDSAVSDIRDNLILGLGIEITFE